MTKRYNDCQSFTITAKALKLLGIICTFWKSNLYLGRLPRFYGGIGGKFGLKGEISHFPGLSNGICPNGP